MLSDFRKSIAFWKVRRLRPFVRLASITCKWRWAWSNGGMILRKTEVLGEKSVTIPLCPLQISHGMNWDWTCTSAVTGQQLTPWFMARHSIAHWNSDQDKDSARTAQWTHSVSAINTSQLILCKEIIAVCSDIHTKYVNTLCGQNVEFLNVKPGGKYSHHRALIGALFYNNLYEFLKSTRYTYTELQMLKSLKCCKNMPPCPPPPYPASVVVSTRKWTKDEALTFTNFKSFKTSLICDNSKYVIFQEKRLKVLKCYNFLVQRRHNCSPAASFANCAMTLCLLKVHQQTFPSIPVTQKCQI